MIGSLVGPYRVTRLLGEGGMGAVYEAVNESIERRVAIKVLKEEFARKPEIVGRFFNEARAVNRVSHPSIVQIHEQGQLPDGTAYIIMELLDGVTLSDRLAKSGGRLPVKNSLDVCWQVAAALTAAHAKGIVHRDLKPSNLMLVPDPLGPGGERVKVLDFGIAKLLADTRGQTASHVVMGTPVYMSPEQCRGAGSVDEKADVYSLGAILFQLLSGRPPFIAEGAGEVIGQHLYHPPPHLRKLMPQLSQEIADFVNQMLAKEKEPRPSMQEVVTRLSQLSSNGTAKGETSGGGRGKSARRRGARGTGLFIIGGSFVLGGLILYFGLPAQKASGLPDMAGKPTVVVPPAVAAQPDMAVRAPRVEVPPPPRPEPVKPAHPPVFHPPPRTPPTGPRVDEGMFKPVK